MLALIFIAYLGQELTMNLHGQQEKDTHNTPIN